MWTGCTRNQKQSFQTCEHVAVELFQLERVVMQFLDHLSGLINAMLTSHFPEE